MRFEVLIRSIDETTVKEYQVKYLSSNICTYNDKIIVDYAINYPENRTSS